jgi:hypothetical protein
MSGAAGRMKAETVGERMNWNKKEVTKRLHKRILFVLPILSFLSGCITEYGIAAPSYDHPIVKNHTLSFNPDDDEQNLIFQFMRPYGYPFTCATIGIRSRIPHQNLRIHEVSFIWKNKKKYILKNLSSDLSMEYRIDYKGSYFYRDAFGSFYDRRIHIHTTALFGGMGLKKPKWNTERYVITDKMLIPVTIVYSYEDGILRTETDMFTVQCRRRDAIELPWFIAMLSR